MRRVVLATVMAGCVAASLPAQEASPERLVQFVDPFIGTGGNRYVCSNNPPAATVPFGSVRLCPDTISASGVTATNMSGYYYDDPHIIGFSHTRLCGTGAVDGGHFRVIPGVAQTPLDQMKTARLRFSHENETALPGFYSVDLPDVQARAELTATTRVGVHRYTYESGVAPQILIDVGSVLGRGRSAECQVRVDSDAREITGSVRTFGSFSGRYGGLQVYFAAHCLNSWDRCVLWQQDTVKEAGESAAGDDVGVSLEFSPADEEQRIDLAIALSYVSVENARENLQTELGDQTFETVRANASQYWEQMLSRAQVAGGQDDRKIFYTGLYRSLMMPTTFTEVNGEYRGFDKEVHRADGFTYYTDMSLWDTFRTTHPLYTLLTPDQHRDMILSLAKMVEQGGSLPRWPSGCGYTNSMFGAPAEIVIAEAWLKGIQGFDIHPVYDAMRRAAMEPAPPGAPWSGRRGLSEYLKYGYCPADMMKEAVAKTLEYTTTDAAIGKLAKALGKEDDAEYFSQRGQNYRNVWNSETQFFQPRDASGEYSTPLKPTLLTYFDLSRRYTDDYVEGSALQWRWAVAHDPAGLVSLFSSPEQFVSELNAFFEQANDRLGALPDGYYWHGNQPDLHAAYLFNAAGRPDLTQKWARWILKHKYGTGPNGLDGNDDGGTLSAWYVLSSLGFYPVPGDDRYELGSPLWSEAKLQLGKATLEVSAVNHAPDRIYVEKVELNGTPLSGTSIRHGEIAAGGKLVFTMTDDPPQR